MQSEAASREMVSRYCQYGNAHMVIAIHTKSAPSDIEWQEYLERVREMLRHLGDRFTQTAGLAVTDGGAPNAAQRHQFVTALGQERPIAAVVTNSALVRGVVTALTWFDVRVKCYAPSAFTAGLQHIGIDDEYHADVARDVVRAARELSTTPATVDVLRQRFLPLEL